VGRSKTHRWADEDEDLLSEGDPAAIAVAQELQGKNKPDLLLEARMAAVDVARAGVSDGVADVGAHP
jgi:hypothetical protein